MEIKDVFENEEFGTLRVFEDEKGNPWFVGRDVCEALGLTAKSIPSTLNRLEKYEKSLVRGVYDHTGKRGGAQLALVVNESGLYSLVFKSNKKKAKTFKKWVTSVVLPSIRKNGGYIEGQENLSKEDYNKLVGEINELRNEVHTLVQENAKERAAKLKVENYLHAEDMLYENLVNELSDIYGETEDYRHKIAEEKARKNAAHEKKEEEKPSVFSSCVIFCDKFGNIATRNNLLESDWR